MFVMTPHHLNNLKRHRIKQQINRKIRASESTTLNWGKNIFLAEFFLFLLFKFFCFILSLFLQIIMELQ